MKQIELSRGKFAIVDDADYDRLSIYKWSYGTNGYAFRGFGPRKNRKYEYLHRVVISAVGGVVDHKNGDKLDCRKENLRLTDRSVNMLNSSRHLRGGRHRGIYFDKSKKKFIARCRIGAKTYYIGRSKSEDEAIEMYLAFVTSRPDIFSIYAT